MRKSAEASNHLFLVRARAKSTAPPPSVVQPPAVVQEMVIDGRRYRLVPTELCDAAVASPSAPPPAALAEILTGRELQIAALVAEGRVNKQIAAELCISEWTVSTHLRRIFAKLDVDTRAAMVSKCFEALRARA